MNIFKNRDKALSDDLPGFRERPRPVLPPVEDEVGEAVREQFAKRDLTIDERRKKLDFHLAEFQRHAAAARREAEIYLAQHVNMMEDLAAEKLKLEEWQDHLNKLEAGLPKFGGKDEQDRRDDNPDDNGNAGPGQVVPDKSIKGLAKPLPFDRR